jgi:hypothetical protein
MALAVAASEAGSSTWKHLVQHQLLELAAADGLADPFGPEVELGLDAFVARAAAGPAGCAA